MYKTHFQDSDKFTFNITEQTLLVTKDDLSLHHFSLINIKITPLGPKERRVKELHSVGCSESGFY